MFMERSSSAELRRCRAELMVLETAAVIQGRTFGLVFEKRARFARRRRLPA